MGQPASGPSPGVADGNNRLDSWKEIAAYVGRGVTTVQRWERDEGLPVHRLQHEKQGSVYAFRHELDAWRSGRREFDPDPASEFLTLRFRRRTLILASTWVTAAGLIVGVMLYIRGLPAPANQCRHPANLGRNVVTALAEYKGRLYAARANVPGGGWLVEAIENAANPDKRTVVHRGADHIERLAAGSSALYTILYGPKSNRWAAYRSEDGWGLTGGVNAEKVYEGDARVDGLVPMAGDGLMGAFSGSAKDDPCGVYFSPRGRRLAVTAAVPGVGAERRYYGRFQVEQMASFRGGLMSAFVNERTGESEGIYLSTDGRRPGIVGASTSVVLGPMPGDPHVEWLVETPGGMLVAFYSRRSGKNWGMYLSRDGQRLAGGGQTVSAYGGPARAEALLPYGGGVIAALYHPASGESMGVYYSPDGLNLGGGGRSLRIYSGALRVSALARVGDGVAAAFFDPKTGEGHGLSFSPDGQTLPETAK